MIEKQRFKNIDNFYDEYKKIILLREVYKEFNYENHLYLITIKKFINKYYNSLKENTSNKNKKFKNYSNKYSLNLLDIEILTLIKLKKIEEFSKNDIKLIFENISLFNLKEYDFNLFKRYIFNSNLISNKIIDYDVEEFKFKFKIIKLKYLKLNKNKFRFYNKYPHYSKIINKKQIDYKITKKEINYLLNKQINLYKNNNLKNNDDYNNKIRLKYNNLNELEEDFLFLKEIKNTPYPNELLNKQINKKLFNYIYKLILNKIENSKEKLNFITKLKLKPEEIIILLKYYNKSKDKILDYEQFNNLIDAKVEEKIKSKLLKNKYIFIKIYWGLEYTRISKKLISLIENKKYSKKEKEFDKENFESDDESFLNEVKSNIDFNSVFIDENKKEILKSTLIQIKENNLIFNEWGLGKSIGYGKGLIINFYGPPGTGKTMLARSIGNYLNKKIIEINFSNLQSKYVGDTEKNISKAFKIATEKDDILFFDEADSLIQNRNNSSRSWERSQVNVLLKEIEEFEGVCIFATNFLESYDPAIERRIALNLEFEKPNENIRKKIFNNYFKKTKALDKNVDFNKISKKYDFTGGEIKNAILHAARFAASDKNNLKKKISQKHIEFGCNLVKESKFNNSDFKFEKNMYL